MLGSCLMIGIQGLSLSKEEKNFIVSNNIAGVVLFKRNLQSFRQIFELCLEIKSLSNPSPLIAIDMEGGEVNRFSHLKESLPWPSPKVLGTLQAEQVFLIAKSMAKQLYLLGIDINFAPVVDLLLVKNSLLETRVFGKSKADILKFASAFIEGLIEEKIISCLKHFPGHGGVSEDSHNILPKDSRHLTDLEPQLKIFQNLFEKYSCWIMTAHIEFSNIEKTPATFSQTLLKQKLRKDRGFKDILVSDDIDMEALACFSPPERFSKALKGGCDLVIACQNKQSPEEIIKYFNKNPNKKAELTEELKNSSEKLFKIKKRRAKPLSDFKNFEEELEKIETRKLFYSLNLI